MARTWKPEPELLGGLDAAVPEILASQKENGQFGTEPWISTDQNVMLALAAAWSLKDSEHHHSDEVLDAVVRGGYALIEGQDDAGMFLFEKKDYSTWGQIFQPWIYSRWVRAYALVREAMSAGAVDRWDQGLLLGYGGISDRCLGSIHNIPAHHAMGLYCAGDVFGREAWQTQARAFMRAVADSQSPQGWWAEHKGPVVSYNFVYSEALGVYYSLSGDADVLDALERAARYHATLTYPDGSAVETVDGRNPYHTGVRLGNVGFTHTAAGRGYLARQHALQMASSRPFNADYAANVLLYGGEGPLEETPAGRERHTARMGEDAWVVRRRPWFTCLSGFTVEQPLNRWGQARQNYASVYHDRTGLVLGGGNTKLQPLWSNFTVGDTGLLRHTPGDEDPEFQPKGDLLHMPDEVVFGEDEDAPCVSLAYGEEKCHISLNPRSDTELDVVYRASATSGAAVEGHVTVLPRIGGTLRTSGGEEGPLGELPISWHVPEEGGWIEHAGWRLSLPGGAGVVWPALPHNPYRKGGEATIEEGRLVVVLPFPDGIQEHEMRLRILD